MNTLNPETICIAGAVSTILEKGVAEAVWDCLDTTTREDFLSAVKIVGDANHADAQDRLNYELSAKNAWDAADAYYTKVIEAMQADEPIDQIAYTL